MGHGLGHNNRCYSDWTKWWQWFCWHRPSTHRTVGRVFESHRGRWSKQATQLAGNSHQILPTSNNCQLNCSDPQKQDKLRSNRYTTAMRRKCSIVSTSSWACDEVLLCPWGWCLGDFLNHTAYHSSHSSGDGRDDWTDRRWAARYENSEPEKSATQTLGTMWFTSQRWSNGPPGNSHQGSITARNAKEGRSLTGAYQSGSYLLWPTGT